MCTLRNISVKTHKYVEVDFKRGLGSQSLHAAGLGNMLRHKLFDLQR